MSADGLPPVLRPASLTQDDSVGGYGLEGAFPGGAPQRVAAQDGAGGHAGEHVPDALPRSGAGHIRQRLRLTAPGHIGGEVMCLMWRWW